jgi:S1-C subfamily serine protease
LAASPAAAAGLRGGDETVQAGNVQVPIGGDIITAIDDQPVTSLQDLTVYLEDRTQVGDTVTLTIQRDGEQQTVEVTLAERPQQQE